MRPFLFVNHALTACFRGRDWLGLAAHCSKVVTMRNEWCDFLCNFYLSGGTLVEIDERGRVLNEQPRMK